MCFYASYAKYFVNCRKSYDAIYITFLQLLCVCVCVCVCVRARTCVVSCVTHVSCMCVAIFHEDERKREGIQLN